MTGRLAIKAYSELGAFAVLSRMDLSDLAECALMRGPGTSALAIFADWHASEPLRLASFVAYAGHGPAAEAFAVFGLMQSGQQGVAHAAFLARDHSYFRRDIAHLAVEFRARLPAMAQAQGIHRIEARAWARHPAAGRMLRFLHFDLEATMPGFGPRGQESFLQFARHFPETSPLTSPETSQEIQHVL